MRVCYFGTYRGRYSRNAIMIESLRRNGVEVVECHQELWTDVEDRVRAASGGWRRPAFWARVLRTYARLLKQYRTIGPYDILLVGYPGQFDVFLARLLSWRRRRPLVWDVFMSIYLIAVERGLAERSPLTIRALRWLERRACRLPDRLILDTAEYVAWFGRVHGVPPARFGLVPTGADSRIYRPMPCPRAADGSLRVVYYGTFIPNHGVEHIVEAARLLSAQPAIRFRLIGDGPERPKAQELAQRYGLTNVEFSGWLEPAGLVQEIACADVLLGAFGVTPQSLMTVQNKVYEGLAMARPVITGASPAVEAALRHGEEVYVCRRADGADLARAIQRLCDDSALRHRLAEQGHRRFLVEYDLQALGRRYLACLEGLAG